MFDQSSTARLLPEGVGVGYKPQHFTDLMSDPGPVEWIEVHAENYMGDGGRPHAQPASFSEHLAWSTHGAEFLNDLLPLPYTEATLTRVADHIAQVQDTLGRQMLLENPSSYLAFAESTLSETDFLAALVHRTGCGLLLDVNNVFVSSTNLGLSPQAYIDAYPLMAVGEIHVGGHDTDTDDHGAPLLIDSHGSPVVDPVWALLEYTLARSGPKPVLVEWDTDVPDWSVLRDEAMRAASALAPVRG